MQCINYTDESKHLLNLRLTVLCSIITIHILKQNEYKMHAGYKDDDQCIL